VDFNVNIYEQRNRGNLPAVPFLMPRHLRAIQNKKLNGQNELAKTPNFIEKSIHTGDISSFHNAIDTYIEPRYTLYIEMRYIKA
jgi:hypothetical protein